MTQAREILKVLGERRRDLGMPVATLAKRAGLCVSTTKRILAGNPRVAFASVVAIADALGIRDLRHSENIVSMREKQASEKAKRLVRMVQATSSLEGQAVDGVAEKRMVARTVTQLLRGSSAALWA